MELYVILGENIFINNPFHSIAINFHYKTDRRFGVCNTLKTIFRSLPPSPSLTMCSFQFTVECLWTYSYIDGVCILKYRIWCTMEFNKFYITIFVAEYTKGVLKYNPTQKRWKKKLKWRTMFLTLLLNLCAQSSFVLNISYPKLFE